MSAGVKCSFVRDERGEIDSDGCRLHDLIVCGPLMGGCR